MAAVLRIEVFSIHRSTFRVVSLTQVVQKADGDDEEWNRGDMIPGIINTAPVPVICMSGSVNEEDGLR